MVEEVNICEEGFHEVMAKIKSLQVPRQQSLM